MWKPGTGVHTKCIPYGSFLYFEVHKSPDGLLWTLLSRKNMQKLKPGATSSRCCGANAQHGQLAWLFAAGSAASQLLQKVHGGC